LYKIKLDANYSFIFQLNWNRNNQ